MKNKVIVVVGPTAVGKTKISIELAKYLNVDIISGDSIAIYKRLDIGSAKPTIEERDGIIHHLIDIKDLTIKEIDELIEVAKDIMHTPEKYLEKCK